MKEKTNTKDKTVEVKIYNEHNNTKEIFPKNFKTIITCTYHKKRIKHPGFWTEISKTAVYVPETFTEIGDTKALLITGNNGLIYNVNIFYKSTGRHFTEFVKKVKIKQ